MTDQAGTYDTQAAREISLDRVTAIMRDLGANKIYVKKLAPNDNSKNQPYFGAHLTDLPFIPTEKLVPSESSSKKTSDSKRKVKYQTAIRLSWVDAEGSVYPAQNSKLIYYPQYPEVRFSGFLQGSKVELSRWMSPQKEGRAEGRWLILGVSNQSGQVFGYLATPESSLSKELEDTDYIPVSNIFQELDVEHKAPRLSTRDALIQMLLEIHQMGWVPGQRLKSDMTSIPYKAGNGGGYTLEALLGISPNGIAEPDYLGWEVKQFGVKGFPIKSASPTTLMTPEPNGGLYKDQGVEVFIRKYGYNDRNGKADRMNFGGVHLVGTRHESTELTMELSGFDAENGQITNASGAIVLLDKNDNETASWSFAKMMDHWKRKHAQAVYIPCMRQASTSGKGYEYHYGKDVELGTGTYFEMMLAAMHSGTVYYDPGIKMEKASTQKPEIKRRSQFRMKHKHLDTLYTKFEFVDVAI